MKPTHLTMSKQFRSQRVSHLSICIWISSQRLLARITKTLRCLEFYMLHYKFRSLTGQIRSLVVSSIPHMHIFILTRNRAMCGCRLDKITGTVYNNNNAGGGWVPVLWRTPLAARFSSPSISPAATLARPDDQISRVSTILCHWRRCLKWQMRLMHGYIFKGLNIEGKMALDCTSAAQQALTRHNRHCQVEADNWVWNTMQC